MSCLTVDCCGNGRMVESIFDFCMFMWWIAGAVTLTVAKNAADAVGTPERGARLAVVTLSWISGFIFLALGAVNAMLATKLAQVKKLAMQQQQQQFAAGQGIAVSPFAPAFGAHQFVPPGATVVYPGQPQPQWGGAPAGYPGGAPPPQQPQWQQPQQPQWQQPPQPPAVGAPVAQAPPPPAA
jgi:hypothetical protein